MTTDIAIALLSVVVVIQLSFMYLQREKSKKRASTLMFCFREMADFSESMLAETQSPELYHEQLHEKLEYLADLCVNAGVEPLTWWDEFDVITGR